MIGRPVELLLVEDNPGDVRLTVEALKETKLNNNLTIVKNGVEALAYLRQEGDYTHVPRPDLILLDLNLPKKDGREALGEIKADENLKRIPIVVLTTSKAEEDILSTYDLGVSGFVIKPITFESLVSVLKTVSKYWFEVVEPPPQRTGG